MNDIHIPNSIDFHYQVVSLTLKPGVSDQELSEVISELPAKFDGGPWILGGYYRFDGTDTVAILLVKPDISRMLIAA